MGFQTLLGAATVFSGGLSWPGPLLLLYPLYLGTLKPVRTSPSINFFRYLPGGSGSLFSCLGLTGGLTPFGKE